MGVKRPGGSPPLYDKQTLRAQSLVKCQQRALSGHVAILHAASRIWRLVETGRFFISCAGLGIASHRSPGTHIVKIARSQGRSQRLYIAHRGLSEEALVLPIELAWTFVSHRESCTRCIKFLCEHLLPCCMKPKLLLKLKGTHRCETTEVMMQS